MSRIIPIPTTRVGDFFVRQRLISQVQSDQVDLFRLQTQVSTGRRIFLPSEDAPAALRAINLQRVLQRKDQIKTNLNGSKSVLFAAETSLGHVSQQLSDVRGAAISVADTISSEESRQAVIQAVDAALRSLVNVGNTNYNGRYLFSGSRTNTLPFDYNGDFVQYSGNEKNLQNFVDLGLLFDTNVPGSQVFGGLSGEVRGTADLDPHLTFDTFVSTINGGQGLGTNAAIAVSVNVGGPTTTSIVDLSGAATIGDVARLIEANPPAGAFITVDINENNGLTITSSVGSVRVDEVAAGRTAKELGIFSPANTLASVTGSDLDPALLKTTPLANLLGTKAQGRLVSVGSNNDLVLKATANGMDFNGVTVEFVGGGIAGSEIALYDVPTKTLTVQIQDGASTAAQVAAAITAAGAAGTIPFTAQTDYRDASTFAQTGVGAISAVDFGPVTDGGSGEPLDLASGLLLTNGGSSATLDVSGAETVEDLLNLINSAGVGLLAEINATNNGINVRSVLSGADFTIGENGGTTATQLGVRTYTGATRLADFNRSVGVPTSDTANDLEIVARDGTVLSIDLTGATTVQDVLDRINTAAGTAGVGVTARLAITGNGIEIVDATGGGGTLAVNEVEGSQAAEYLGFMPNDPITVDGGGNQVLASEDRHTLEVDSVFNSLIRLRRALEANDVPELGRAIDRLDLDLTRVNFARAEIGSRLQSLDVIQTRLEDENVQLRAALSDEIDVDLVEAISNLTARQYALQASLQTTANILNLSILDYI